MNTYQVEHEEYQHYKSIWVLNNAFCKDEKAVKNLGKDALPVPFSGENGAQIESDYQTFKDSAPFLGFAAKTLQTMSGLINRVPAKLELSTQLEYLTRNANGNGLGLAQHISRTVTETCKNARYGVLIELPKGGGQTMADNINGAMPRLIGYDALEIPWWNDEGTAIVLRESVEPEVDNPSDITSILGTGITETRYRILYLDENGNYKQRLYGTMHQSGGEDIDVTVNGRPLKYIPFKFFGSENNDSTVDDSQITSIVTANKNHFYNSALDQNITTMCSLIGFFISSEMSVDEIGERFPDGLTYGARECNFLGVNDTVQLVQATESNAAARKADKILEDAKQLGAKMVTPDSQMTATEASINASSDGSYLGLIAINIEEGYNDLLRMISEMLGITQESTVSVNKQFVTSKMTPQERQAWANDVVLGHVTIDEYREKLQESGEVAEADNSDLVSNNANPDSINEFNDE